MARAPVPEDRPITLSLAQPDIRLALDLGGVIQHATASGGIAEDEAAAMAGLAWGDTVGADGDQVRRMVEAATRTGASAFGQVTQHFPSGKRLRIEYTTVLLGREAGLVAVGKNLSAVATLQSREIAIRLEREQDHWKLRDVEGRYRLLFEASSEAVIVLGGGDLRILELNPAAGRALGLAPGDDFAGEFKGADRDRFLATLAHARVQGRLPAVIVHLGPDDAAWTLRASHVASDVTSGGVFVLQLGHSAAELIGGNRAGLVRLDDLADRLPDAFLVIDPKGIVLRANPAFLDLIQASAEGAIVGEDLARWLHHPGADLDVILAMLERHRVVRRLVTTIYGTYRETEVELSAAGSSDLRPRTIGLMMRHVATRREPVGIGGLDLKEIPADLGQTSMLKRVREATQAIEREYILAALRQAGGNRSVAAELLGMSRQTLYIKLGRYGPEDDIPRPYGRSS